MNISRQRNGLSVRPVDPGPANFRSANRCPAHRFREFLLLGCRRRQLWETFASLIIDRWIEWLFFVNLMNPYPTLSTTQTDRNQYGVYVYRSRKLGTGRISDVWPIGPLLRQKRPTEKLSKHVGYHLNKIIMIMLMGCSYTWLVYISVRGKIFFLLFTRINRS